MSGNSRFHIGIDLGTTNCALAYFDTLRPELGVQCLPIAQWMGPGQFDRCVTLPSFVYLAPKGEWKKGQLNVPDLHPDEPQHFTVGHGARRLALSLGGRVAHSAKSWLAHPDINPRDPILPWNSDDVVGDQRLSAVEVSKQLLEHLKLAWEKGPGSDGPECVFNEQVVSLGIPASFNEAAQRLTLEAAREAGYPETVTLVEEPLAAFHMYLRSHPHILSQLAGQREDARVLVCDIGGGTCDFSLFDIMRRPDQLPEVRRSRVSKHLLLGGDNIDLELARQLEPQFGAIGSLRPQAWGQLVAACRGLKEKIMGQEGEASQEHKIAITTGGRSLFAAAKTAKIKRWEVRDLVLEHFFPPCEVAGLAEHYPDLAAEQVSEDAGLLFAVDQAFTRHLGAFLGGTPIDAVLFAGGTMKPNALRERITTILQSWQKQRPIVELETRDLDLTVAHGCSLAVLQKQMIKGGYPRNLYVEAVDGKGGLKWILLVAKGDDIEQPLRLNIPGLKVKVGQPCQFKVYSDAGYGEHGMERGDVRSPDASIRALPPLVTTLPAIKDREGQWVDVELEVCLSPTGLLDIYCTQLHDHVSDAEPGRWQLQFETKTKMSAQVRSQQPQQVRCELAKVKDLLTGVYGRGHSSLAHRSAPSQLMKEMEVLLGPRASWDIVTLRQIWPWLQQGLTRRGRSKDHEYWFLYLAGYCLRPGYGDPHDPERLADLWQLFNLGMSFPKEKSIANQWWVLWRRVAGGLSKEQQHQLFKKIFPAIRNDQNVTAEMILLAGALERIDVQLKVLLGQKLVEQIRAKKKLPDQRMWALARIASRVPLYAGPDAVVRATTVESWADELAGIDTKQKPFHKLALFYAMAGRFLGRRDLDLSGQARDEFYRRHARSGAPEEGRTPLKIKQKVDFNQHNQMFGEDLPHGLLFL